MKNRNARQLLMDLGINPSEVPIRLDTIVEKLGYRVFALHKKDAPSDFAGAVDYSRKAIFVNDDDCYNRQRFTIAHEIAHTQLHENPSIIDYRQSFWNDKEREANQFAAELLMPAPIFIDLWRQHIGSLPVLSKLFAVSEDAVYFRARNLGLI